MDPRKEKWLKHYSDAQIAEELEKAAHPGYIDRLISLQTHRRQQELLAQATKI